MSEIIIRIAKKTDAKTISEILRELDWFEHIKAQSYEETLRKIERHLILCISNEDHSVYVAEIENMVVGYAAVHWLPYLFLPAQEGYVSELFVSSKYRGGGVGKSLMEAIIREGRNKGCSRLMLINGRTRESYKRNFYANLGWTERKQVANFIYNL